MPIEDDGPGAPPPEDVSVHQSSESAQRLLVSDNPTEYLPRPTYNKRARANAKLAGKVAILKQQNAELAYRATHDKLTGLLNRDGWGEQVKERHDLAEHAAKEGLAENPYEFGVLFLDLTNFKKVQDSLGKDKSSKHAAGDKILKGLAGVLTGSLRTGTDEEQRPPEDVIGRQERISSKASEAGRYGGDEFTVLVDLSKVSVEDMDLAPGERMEKIVQRLCDGFDAFLDADEQKDLNLRGRGLELAVGASIWEAGKTTAEMLAEADQKMNQNKDEQHAKVRTHEWPPIS